MSAGAQVHAPEEGGGEVGEAGAAGEVEEGVEEGEAAGEVVVGVAWVALGGERGEWKGSGGRGVGWSVWKAGA